MFFSDSVPAFRNPAKSKALKSPRADERNLGKDNVARKLRKLGEKATQEEQELL